MVFYSDEEEAGKNLDEFLKSPSHLRMYRHGIQINRTQIPSFDHDSDAVFHLIPEVSLVPLNKQ